MTDVQSINFETYESRLDVFQKVLKRPLDIHDVVCAIIDDHSASELAELEVQDAQLQKDLIEVARECCNFVNLYGVGRKLMGRVLSTCPVAMENDEGVVHIEWLKKKKYRF